MRIELGAGYGRDWDRIAESVIDRHFLDAFAAGKSPHGLREGNAAIIDEIVRPFLAGTSFSISVRSGDSGGGGGFGGGGSGRC